MTFRFARKPVIATAALLIAASGVALAASPHFVGRVTATLESDGDLTVSWKEAGLGNNQNINYTAGATSALATYHCFNPAGQCPNADNKQDVAGPALASGTFNSGQNGSINGSLTASPPAATFSCPPGQTMVLTEVTYSGIQVRDVTNNIVESATPSTLHAVLRECP